jgi:phospholipid transport system substrate-binding protein
MKRALLLSLFAFVPVISTTSSAAAPPVAPASGAVPAPGSPTAVLKSKNGEVDRLLRQKVDPGSAAEAKQKAEIKVLAASLLDYAELTKRAMAEHWDQINAAQRAELVATLKELIERNYVKQIRSNLDYQIQYKDEKITGAEAQVLSIVKVKTKGKSTDAEIVYKLRKVSAPEGEKWLVWDVVTDEVSLMRNYKSQFHRIITESGFDELLRKMKKKLAEKDKD